YPHLLNYDSSDSPAVARFFKSRAPAWGSDLGKSLYNNGAPRKCPVYRRKHSQSSPSQKSQFKNRHARPRPRDRIRAHPAPQGAPMTTPYDNLPKVELHLHLEGAIPYRALWQLVQKYGGDAAVPSL